jgi:fused signal recognition particle receptor
MGFLGKISQGLFKTRQKVSQEVTGVLGKGALSEENLEELEERLITADICVDVAVQIVEKIRKRCKGQFLSGKKLLAYLEEFALELLITAPPLEHNNKPHTILVLGVNGVGKTTSIAKLANYYKIQGKKVLVAAGDTFRAGAIEQLEIWCNRVGVDIVKHQEKSDAAAVVYDAWEAAKARDMDILLIDTAGRLHNKEYLMEELKKIIRVLKKHDENLPQETLLVIDGNTGQNAIQQAKVFNQIHPIDGFVVTKLDGTAKGGAILSINHEMKIPVRWVGVGEQLNDLIPFTKEEYVNGMFGSADIDIALEQQEIENAYKSLEI